MDAHPDGWAAGLGEFLPMLQRIEALDASTPVRLRVEPGEQAITAFVTLPFGVLVSRTVPWRADAPGRAPTPIAQVNRTVVLADLLQWLMAGRAEPARRDELWKGALPPLRGWARLDSLADSVVREQVRVGATALKDLGDHAGDGEQIRQPAIEALLDSVVLTVTSDVPSAAEGATTEAPISLRTLSALARMGFMPRDSTVGIDVCRGWIRIVGGYGAAYAVNPAAGGQGGVGGLGGLGLLPVLR